MTRVLPCRSVWARASAPEPGGGKECSMPGMNLASVLIALVIAVLFVVIVVPAGRKKKRGGGCGGDCAGCGGACGCHHTSHPQ